MKMKYTRHIICVDDNRRASIQILWNSSVWDSNRSYHWIHHHRCHFYGVSIISYFHIRSLYLCMSFTYSDSALNFRAINRSNCFHKNGHHDGCHTLNNSYLLIFGLIEIVLSQIPNFHKLSLISIVATIMSFTYATIGIALSIAKIAGQYLYELVPLYESNLEF